MKQPLPLELKQEIKLHVNQRLYDQGLIPRSLYEAAKQKILESTIKPMCEKTVGKSADG